MSNHRVHVHLDGFALRAQLDHYGISAFVRMCAEERNCWVVSNDSREIVREEMPALVRG